MFITGECATSSTQNEERDPVGIRTDTHGKEKTLRKQQRSILIMAEDQAEVISRSTYLLTTPLPVT